MVGPCALADVSTSLSGGFSPSACGALESVCHTMGGDKCIEDLEKLRPCLSDGLQPIFDTVLSKILKCALWERAGWRAQGWLTMCLDLEECADGDAPVLEYRTPEELESEIGNALSLPQEGLGLQGIADQLEPVLRFSPKTSHVHFFNQLFAGFDVPSILADFVTAALNTTSYTYEIGPVTTLIEKKLIQRLLQLVGFENGDGVFAPGGSISNLMAFLAARHVAVPGSRKVRAGPTTDMGYSIGLTLQLLIEWPRRSRSCLLHICARALLASKSCNDWWHRHGSGGQGSL